MVTKRYAKKKLIIIAAVLVLSSLAVGVYLYTQSDDKSVSIVSDPNFNDGTDRTPGQSVERSGGVVADETPDPNVPENEPVVSTSGSISVYDPVPNQVLKSGDRLYGTATVDTVWYRLIDDKIGMITQGSMPVKDGRFSGVFTFTSDGADGRLDIFYMTDDGREADNIEIKVKFN